MPGIEVFMIVFVIVCSTISIVLLGGWLFSQLKAKGLCARGDALLAAKDEEGAYREYEAARKAGSWMGMGGKALAHVHLRQALIHLVRGHEPIVALPYFQDAVAAHPKTTYADLQTLAKEFKVALADDVRQAFRTGSLAALAQRLASSEEDRVRLLVIQFGEFYRMPDELENGTFIDGGKANRNYHRVLLGGCTSYLRGKLEVTLTPTQTAPGVSGTVAHIFVQPSLLHTTKMEFHYGRHGQNPIYTGRLLQAIDEETIRRLADTQAVRSQISRRFKTNLTSVATALSTLARNRQASALGEEVVFHLEQVLPIVWLTPNRFIAGRRHCDIHTAQVQAKAEYLSRMSAEAVMRLHRQSLHTRKSEMGRYVRAGELSLEFVGATG